MDNKFKLDPNLMSSIKLNNPINDSIQNTIRQAEQISRDIESSRRAKNEEDLRRHNELVEALKSAGENGATIVVGDNNNGIQIQQKAINSEQHIVNSVSFDYVKAKQVLEEIKEYFDFPKFDESFGENSENIKQVVEDAINAIEHKEDPSLIKKSLNLIKEFAIGVSGSLVASGIVALITGAGIL